MRRVKRLGLSLASAAIAVLLAGATLALLSHGGSRREVWFAFLRFASGLAVSGWLLTVPLIMRFDPMINTRIKYAALTAILIGPIVFLGADAFSAFMTMGSGASTKLVLLYSALSMIVSVLAAVIYIASYRLLHRYGILSRTRVRRTHA